MPDHALRAEEALAAALAELNAARDRIAQLETLSDLSERLVDAGSFQMDWDTMQVRWSDNTLAIFGVSRQEFRQNYTSVTEFIHEDDRASFDATMARVIATRGRYAHRHRIVRPNGEVRYVREVAETIGGAEGNLFLGVTQDITDLVETKAAEAELQAMVKLAGKIGKVRSWRLNLDTQTVELTPVDGLSHNASELRRLTLSEALAPYKEESSERLQAAFAKSIENSGGFDETLTSVSRSGREHTVRVFGYAERDQDSGRIVGLRGAIHDITELAEAQEAERRSSEFARMAGRVARLGGWRFDIARQEISWSPETAIIHDEPPGTAPRLEDAINYYVPEHRASILAALDECVVNGRPYDDIGQIVTAKGRKIWVRAIGEPVRDAVGQIVAVQGAFKDITDLIAERSASQEVAARLQRTLESINDAFFLLDADWRFSFINSQAERMLQHSRGDLLGKVIWDEFPEFVGSTFQTQYERVVRDGGAVRFVEFYSPSNRCIEVDASASPDGLSVYFRDITDQRAKDAQLRLLEAAVARVNDIVLITEAEPMVGPDGPKIVYVNDAFERRTGYSRADVLGKTPGILQGPKTQRRELDRIRRALQDWQPVRAELVNYTKSGEEFWLELDIVPLANDIGRFTHWVAVERDISDRKDAEQALRINEERFRLVARAAGNAIWEWDVVTGNQWYSEGLREIFGHSPELGQSEFDVRELNIHPDDATRVASALERLRSGAATSMVLQYRFRHADGTWATIEERAFAMRDEDGRALRILGSMTDISEQLLLETRLRQAQKMDAVGQLTGGIAHDFNNLLTVMMGNSEVLADQLSHVPHLQGLARMTVDAVDRAAEMTSRLLAFSRKQPLEPRVLNLGQLVQGLDGLLRRTLPENIDIEIIRGGGLWNTELDAGQVEAALLNLALNARDAMPEGGSLTIETANCALDDSYVLGEHELVAGQYVMLVVTDTGHGIPKDQLGHIFEPFFTTKEVGKGSGLGLSMIYGFVKQSGGHIRVYSEPGEGTAFRLYFPRSMTNEAQNLENSDRTKSPGGAETILVVEDDSMVRAYVVAQLRSLGYRVFEATNGNEAIEILGQNASIDLLFTDVVMPGGMGGRALADAARALTPSIKILFTSGYTENSIVHDGRLDPGVQLLSKPYRREQLALKIRKVLGGK